MASEFARIGVWMDICSFLLWISCLELAEFVHHRTSVDWEVSGIVCIPLGRRPHLPRRLQNFRWPNGRPIFPRLWRSGHSPWICSDNRDVLETPRTAHTVRRHPKSVNVHGLFHFTTDNLVGFLETASQRFLEA